MKQILLFLMISFVFSFIPITISNETLNILFGLLGVLFSVGMSLIIVFNLRQVLNKKIRKKLREEIHLVRSNYFILFFLSTIVFTIQTLLKNDISVVNICNLTIEISLRFGVLFSLLYSIFELSRNFISIHNLYEELEDKIDEENKN